jgi:hypothetical protein
MKTINIVGAAVAIGATAGAIASPVTVSQTFALGQLLNGSATTLQFDLGSTLAGQGLTAMNVLSGNVVVYGVSDAAYGPTSAQAYGAYTQEGSNSYIAYYAYGGGGYQSCSYSWWGAASCYYEPVHYSPVYATDQQFLHSRDLLHADTVADRMDVSIGGVTGSALANTFSSVTDAYGQQNFEAAYRNGSNGYNRYYNRERDVYEALSGSLSVDLGLDTTALADFAADGMLSAQVSAGIGQFRLTSAVLTLQIDDAPAPGVPEPGSLALGGIAAAALLATRRRRRL